MQKAEHAEARGVAGTGQHGPPEMLAPFIRYLEEAGLMKLHVERSDPDLEVDWAAMDNGIRLHALVVLGNRLGLGAPYEFGMYMFGPCSRRLAEDARMLQRNRSGLYDGVRAAVPDAFKREEFEGLVRGRDSDWLMAASTLVDMRADSPTRERLAEAIIGDRPAYTKEYVSGMLGDLERAGLVTAYP